MKKDTVSKICVVLCGILFFGILIYYTSQEQEEEFVLEEFYYPSYDLPAVEESESAYLRDYHFPITTDNLYDCLCDYFAAPSILYYHFDHGGLLIKNEKAAEFANAFRDISFTEADPFKSHLGRDYFFENAIGYMEIWEEEGIIYVRLDFNNRTTFCTSDLNLLTALDQIRASLKPYSEEIPKNIDPPHD